MKRDSSFRKVPGSILLAIWLLLTTASSAAAYNFPGPLPYVTLLSVVAAFFLLTLAAGSHIILTRIDEARHLTLAKSIFKYAIRYSTLAYLLVCGLFSPFFALLLISAYALVRGVTMVVWSIQAKRTQDRPAHLEGSDPGRLRAAGILLVVVVLIAIGYSAANYVPMLGMEEWYAYKLNNYTKMAHQAAVKHLATHPTGEVVTCADIEAAAPTEGFTIPFNSIDCFSDMTATSGGIRMTAPKSTHLTQPVAGITYAGELTPAEP